jgi:hypothetical protein
MKYQDAIRKINKLLGLYTFNSYKITESGQELITEGDLIVGEPVYVITDNGQLPAPDGEFELEDTTKIKIEDGIVQQIKYDNMENETEQFVEATLADGVVVKSKTFDVGEDVFVVSPDGTEVKAPDGEHELNLKDAEGKEVLFKIIVKDGKIIERENVELSYDEKEKTDEEMGMTPDLSAPQEVIDEDFKKTLMGVLGEIKDAIGGIVKDQEDMKAKMAKFSKEPAGSPVKQGKNVVNEFAAHQNDAFSKLLKTRHNL